MKQVLLLMALFVACSLQAQVADTLLYENFEVDNSADWGEIPAGDDQTWISFDEDGLDPDGGDEIQKRWYHGFAFYDTLTNDTNYVARSKSWMAGFAVGNRNWLITPQITVPNGNYTLSWKSAPLQLPRYMDGYQVMVSTTNNFAPDGPFTDTLFQAAQMTDITGDANSLDISNYEFSPGYIHGDDVTNWDYLALFTDGDSTLLVGVLEPHTVSLSAYAGKKIYIAFLHNSDDDNQISVDDILVAAPGASGSSQPELANLRLMTYPNPATNWLNVMYRLDNPSEVSMSIVDISGKVVVQQLINEKQLAGEQTQRIGLQQLPRGTYSMTLSVNEQTVSKTFVKQ